jgi:hypothetical protein
MLLAREAINLDTDPQTEGTLLTTLLRSPAALGTFALPIDARPQSVALSPNDRTLAVTDNNGELWFYDTRTRAVKRTLTDIAELEAPVYSSDGSLLIYDGSEDNAVAVVRDAHTMRLLDKLSYDRRWYALPVVCPSATMADCTRADERPPASGSTDGDLVAGAGWQQRRSHKLSCNPGSPERPVAASLACAGCAIGWGQG